MAAISNLLESDSFIKKLNEIKNSKYLLKEL